MCPPWHSDLQEPSLPDEDENNARQNERSETKHAAGAAEPDGRKQMHPTGLSPDEQARMAAAISAARDDAARFRLDGKTIHVEGTTRTTSMRFPSAIAARRAWEAFHLGDV